jgi:S1-C subfamily serine protease
MKLPGISLNQEIARVTWRDVPRDEQRQRTHLCLEKVSEKLVDMKTTDALATAINQSLPANGTIIVNDGTDGWNGSGFLLPHGRLITAQHVIEGLSKEAKINVSFEKDGELFPARVGAGNADIDVAILVLAKVPEVQPMKFAQPESISVGEQIAVIGSPGGWHDVVTTGRVSAVNQDMGFLEKSLSDFILIDADIEPGSSGSMVIDEDGNIVGMVSAMIGEHADIGVGKKVVIPVGKILELIQQSHN